MRGKLITIEGCEGVGKSTQIRLLKEYFEREKIDVVFTREPGGSKIAEQIRQIILDGGNSEMSAECEALLYAAARNQHIKDIIEPAIESGKTVICDRYIDSTYAYQGYARGLGTEFIDTVNKLSVGEFEPDMTIFLDYPPDKAFKRKGGADKRDRLENMDISFHVKVYEGYKTLEKKSRFVAVDASGSKYETHEKIKEVIKEKLGIGG